MSGIIYMVTQKKGVVKLAVALVHVFGQDSVFIKFIKEKKWLMMKVEYN